MKRTLCLLALVSGLTSAVDAQTKRPMALNDLLGAVRIGDPQLSPDGRRVLFSRTTTVIETGRRNGDIWSVPADGSSPPSVFLGGERSENTPRYSADGRRIAFISSRDGASQVYVADGEGRDVKRVTNLSGGVQPPMIISADGRHIAYVSDVFPSCASEDCNKRMRDSLEKDPVKMRRLTELGYRHWDEWRENIRHHVFVTNVETGETRDITPGDFDAPQHFYEDNAIAFSPDGRTIAFSSNRDGKAGEMASTNRDIWLVPITGGALRKLTTNPAADEEPVFSPDGKHLVTRSQRRAGFESDRWYLDVYDVAAGTKRTVFTTPDISVDHFQLSRDGQTIWFLAAEKGLHNLYSVSFAGGAPKLVAKGGSISQFSPGNGFAVFAKSSLTAPTDIHRIGTDGSGAKQLTSENAGWLSNVEMPQVSSMTVTGAAAASVQYWLLKPPGFDPAKKYPVVFLIHGGPQGDWADGWSTRWNPALWASQGWVVAAPNPRGSTGFGQRFVDEISQDWCGKVMTDINAVFAAVGRLPYTNSQRMGIAGASYGGYAVNWIVGHDNRFKAAVSHDGVFNLESMALTTEEMWFTDWEFGGKPWSPTARANFARCSPHLFANRTKTPTLIITNELDFRVPVDQGLQMFNVLRRNNVPSETLVFPDEGHWVLGTLNSKRWHESVFSWMKKYLETGMAQ
jgi:dipeptidyl aminopeptidase/acylaminoacyl peptidase